MELEKAKLRFIESWGTLGTKWGINRTMAQIHALLLISPESLHAENVMETLQVSRGNANMNLRNLIDWGLIRKELKPGQRREYFYAEKDIWKMSRQIVKRRKAIELDPVLQMIEDVEQVEGETDETHEFRRVIGEIKTLTERADDALHYFVRADQQIVSMMLTEMLAHISSGGSNGNGLLNR